MMNRYLIRRNKNAANMLPPGIIGTVNAVSKSDAEILAAKVFPFCMDQRPTASDFNSESAFAQNQARQADFNRGEYTKEEREYAAAHR